MNKHEAVEQISNTVFRPGWHISAQPGSAWWGEQVVVIVEIDTFDTSYPSPDGQYRVPKHLAGMSEVIDVEHLTSDQLTCRLLDLLSEISDHEDRETLRVRQPDGSWKAPLHPHTPSCDRKWESWKLVRELVSV